MSDPTPEQRHWAHVEALRQLYQSMPAGEDRDRMEARWRAAIDDHRRMVGVN